MQCGEQRTVPSPERTSEFSRRQVRVTVAFSRTHRGWQARGAGGVKTLSVVDTLRRSRGGGTHRPRTSRTA